jgi:hypothetical protein
MMSVMQEPKDLWYYKQSIVAKTCGYKKDKIEVQGIEDGFYGA